VQNPGNTKRTARLKPFRFFSESVLKGGNIHMIDNLKRDITGECEGECKDRVREGEEERQEKIAKSSVKSPESYPSPPGAKSRNEPPGFLGGHV
jgi:hypothetical protein